jgi:hypothetical protein
MENGENYTNPGNLSPVYGIDDENKCRCFQSETFNL